MNKKQRLADGASPRSSEAYPQYPSMYRYLEVNIITLDNFYIHTDSTKNVQKDQKTRYYVKYLLEDRGSLVGRCTRIWCVYEEVVGATKDKLAKENKLDVARPIFIGPYALKFYYADINTEAYAGKFFEDAAKKKIQHVLLPTKVWYLGKIMNIVRGLKEGDAIPNVALRDREEIATISALKRTLDQLETPYEFYGAIIGVLKAIESLAEANIIHRDISPGNILLDNEKYTDAKPFKEIQIKIDDKIAEAFLVLRPPVKLNAIGGLHDLDMAATIPPPTETYLGERITSLCPSNSPSETAGSPAKIREVIEGNKSRVYVGRPGGAPAAIFNPALAALQLRLENLDQVKVDHGDVVNAAEYMDKAITAYDDESAREKAIKTCIDIAVGQSGDWNSRLDWADAIKPDCAWWHKLFLTIVLELKNIDGLAGNPSFQSIIDYCKIIPQKKYQEFHEFSNFPVVILGVAENRIDISIAVCVGEIHVSKLLTIDVTAGFLISANILRLARIFKALSLCREDLVRYYDHVEEKANTNIPLSCLYPQPTPLNDSVEMPNLTYTSFMTRDGQPTPALVSLGDLKFTAMYMATMHGIQNKVVVKFTPRYNRCAHELLAEAGFAPKLHFCAPVVGGLFMVVMDYVDGKSLSQLKSPIPAAIPEQVKEAVDLLHKKDIVFGDLRDPNILYSEALNQVFLVDFDWPGKHEGDRYPTALNLMHKWAAGVMRYGLMQKAHDLWQIERIEKLC
ncbi:hypothetical protein H0H81_001495 [Sphagnurus paluster]|uniref:Fungal-type protein kinase domain-containing protein n=1 Tax=Sphagnurus paluster TaxID=117069 RepID=A0A9P7GN09_9AGAR|nr:hypothetical protein H0H81_001495 [Sphagnurus paluster]